MLRSSLGFFSSRGMTTVPDLSGLTRTQADAAILAAGLIIGTTTPTGSSVSSQNNILAGQGIAAGSVVDYDTQLNYSYYNYVDPGGGGTPVTCIETSRQKFPTNWNGPCEGGQQSGIEVTEINYSNCNSTTTETTVYRDCSSGGGGCIQTGSSSSTSCDSCSGGYGLRECYTVTTVSYSNCPSSTESVFSGYRDCGTAPAPAPSPTPSPTPSPGVPSFAVPTPSPPAPSPPIGTPPATYCIDEETLIITVNTSGEKIHKMAKDVEVGEYVLSMKWDELIDQNDVNYLNSTSENLTNIETLPTLVVAKYAFQKNTTMYINNDFSTRMSLEQPILVNRDGLWQWQQSGDVFIGDTLIKYESDNQVVWVDVTSVDYISETRDVYSFNCEDIDTFFAGNILVHNK